MPEKSTKPKNSSAFPVQGWDSMGEDNPVPYTYTKDPGMTLLDYFAGKALGSLSPLMYESNQDDRRTPIEQMVDEAYNIAEAMLREREKRI